MILYTEAAQTAEYVQIRVIDKKTGCVHWEYDVPAMAALATAENLVKVHHGIGAVVSSTEE